MRKKHLQHATGLCVEDARDTLVEPSVEPEEKPEGETMLNRPPLNMLGDTLDDCEALSGETQSETQSETVFNRSPLNTLSDTLVITKHFPIATRGDRTHCGARRETRSETRA